VWPDGAKGTDANHQPGGHEPSSASSIRRPTRERSDAALATRSSRWSLPHWWAEAGECATPDRLLCEIRDGASRSLVLRGDPGIGNSALLDYAAAAVAGFLVIRVTGVGSEMEVAFAALQQACTPLLKHLDQLPAQQADALRVAFGLSRGDPPDRFLVGLGLAAKEAAAQPLLCIVEDAQWIDQTSLQAFAVMTRRLYSESIGVILSARSGAAPGELAGSPRSQRPG
jgi:hypothetical protein